MENFDRVGPSPFGPDGRTIDTEVVFPGGSKLKVFGGNPYHNFRLKFSNSDDEGWWVGLSTVSKLIAELLYLRRDMQRFEDGEALDIEIGMRAQGRLGVEEEDEDGNDPPF